MATKTKTISLTVLVQEGDFEIVASDALEVKAGENVAFTVDVQPLLGFSKPVAFSILGGPVGTVATWQTGSIWSPDMTELNLVCELAVPLDNSLAGTYELTLSGTTD